MSQRSIYVYFDIALSFLSKVLIRVSDIYMCTYYVFKCKLAFCVIFCVIIVTFLMSGGECGVTSL